VVESAREIGDKIERKIIEREIPFYITSLVLYYWRMPSGLSSAATAR
jgi:hypothetical protein